MFEESGGVSFLEIAPPPRRWFKQPRISMHNLASLLVKRDQHDEAQELYQRCLDLERETQGAEHPDTLTCMNLDSSELIMLFPFLKMCAAMICLKPPRCEKLTSFCHLVGDCTHGLRFVGTLGCFRDPWWSLADPLDQAVPRTSLAALWRKLGRHHEAAELHRSCLKARVAVSPEHPSNLVNLSEWVDWGVKKRAFGELGA